MNKEIVLKWINERIESILNDLSNLDKLQINIAIETIEYLEYIKNNLK